MIKILGRHLRESFKSLGRNTWMTFASISAVTVTLILVGVFLVIMLNLNNMAKNAEKEVEIKVLIDLTSNKKTQDTLQNEIKDISGIQSVEFSSKDKELDQLVKSFGDSGKAMKMQDQENPLNNAFIVKTTDPHDTPKVAKKIEKLDHVYKVTYGKEEVSRLFKIVGVSRNIGIALIIGLLFTAMFLISNTIKITIFARRKEIEIMKLVGATNWFIRWPFFLESAAGGIRFYHTDRSRAEYVPVDGRLGGPESSGLICFTSAVQPVCVPSITCAHSDRRGYRSMGKSDFHPEIPSCINTKASLI